ncbi:MAG: lytic transglycosylase F [Nitrospirae bacterium]|nr:MAG: lytic transglycosylase F [Nitrospirota bacterium]
MMEKQKDPRWLFQCIGRTVAFASILWLTMIGLMSGLPAYGAEDPLLQDLPHTKPFTGDLAEMKRRHMIRVLVSYSKTNFFIVKGQPHGFEYELLQQFGKFVNKGVSRKHLKTRIIFIPTPFEELLPRLIDGSGDIAAAGLTITPERQKVVAFTRPYIPNVNEILVTYKKASPVTKLDDLAGRTVYHIAGGSYGEHLDTINATFRRRGLSPIRHVPASDYLATEDLLELTNAGVIPYMVADQHLAELWSGVHRQLVVRKDLVIHKGGQIAWAVRKTNPELLQALNRFIAKHKKGTLIGNVLFKRYYQNRKWITNPLEEQERRKLDRFMAYFKKYGQRYGFDWLALAAQAYQESGLDPNRKSPRGAVGLMQILPETAANPPINIPNIHHIEQNIHAGVKYLAHLRDTYFSSPELTPTERLNFSFAAYNAGPNKIQRVRRKAPKMGLNPNKWFYHVEQAALRYIGSEPVRYVANIHKYYVAYTLVSKTLAQKDRELQRFPSKSRK